MSLHFWTYFVAHVWWFACADLLDLGCCLAPNEMWIITTPTPPRHLDKCRQKQRLMAHLCSHTISDFLAYYRFRSNTGTNSFPSYSTPNLERSI